MNRILGFFFFAFFSIFLGSQITEGCLLVPYWKTLATAEFYEYYAHFGPTIGKFYTVLTILAALIPFFTSSYCLYTKSYALGYSLIATFLAVMFVASFYVYFKDANQQFYNATLTTTQLQSELIIWEYWHWARVLAELLSLIFLILTLNILTDWKQKNSSTN